MKVFPYQAALCCLAILGLAGCSDRNDPSALPIALALRLARANPESTISTRIKGVVSFADPRSGDFVIEDSTGGIRLNSGQKAIPSAGDLVEAAGLLQVGGDTGLILQPKIVVLGRSKRPAPIFISLKDQNGDTNRTVTLKGIVESVDMERAGIQSIVLRSDGRRAVSIGRAIPMISKLWNLRPRASRYPSAPLPDS